MVQQKGQKKLIDIVRDLTDDPFLVQELIDAGKPARRAKLKRLGVGELDRAEVRLVVKSLMTEKHPPRPSAERPVEWVGAIATLVAGALAA